MYSQFEDKLCEFCGGEKGIKTRRTSYLEDRASFSHSHEVLDLVVDGLHVVYERGVVGGAVVALRAQLVAVPPVDALDVRPEVAAARAPVVNG